jgi:hypothetical protein
VAVPCFVPGIGWLADDGCYYQPATGVNLQAAEASGGPASGSAQWYVGECGYPHGIGLTRYRLFSAAPSVQVVAAQAVSALRLPAPAVRLSPASPARQVVRLPMWVWLDTGSWGRRSATASVPGVSVTATAVATRLALSVGDGVSVVCRGSGTVWTADTDPGAESPTCGHVYTAAGAVTLTATVTWSVVWAGGGAAGTVPAVTTTASVAVMVREVAALDTRGGQR